MCCLESIFMWSTRPLSYEPIKSDENDSTYFTRDMFTVLKCIFFSLIMLFIILLSYTVEILFVGAVFFITTNVNLFWYILYVLFFSSIRGLCYVHWKWYTCIVLWLDIAFGSFIIMEWVLYTFRSSLNMNNFQPLLCTLVAGAWFYVFAAAHILTKIALLSLYIQKLIEKRREMYSNSVNSLFY